jgi:hypothetical protein
MGLISFVTFVLLMFSFDLRREDFLIEASGSHRHVGDTTGMGTTDQRLKAAHERGTDDTDEEQRQISGGGFLPPFRHWGGFKAICQSSSAFLSVESV